MKPRIQLDPKCGPPHWTEGPGYAVLLTVLLVACGWMLWWLFS